MIPSRKNKLTVSILERLRERGPPSNEMVPSFDPMGTAEDNSDEDPNDQTDEVTTEVGDNKKKQAISPLRRKRASPIDGSTY